MLAQVTILIPNFKTLELTKLCLRLIRLHTDKRKIKVMVIDNDSQDASLEYLRTLTWIELIERKAIPGESPSQSHARALDLALDKVTTPYVLSIHTDTLVKHPKWLEFLLSEINQDPQIAGVGSWKLENKGSLNKVLKKSERLLQILYHRLRGTIPTKLEGEHGNYYYLRSHCAMYRTDLVQKLKLHFSDDNMVAGKSMHKNLVDAGYKMLFIPADKLIFYLDHINHATTVLNPYLSSRQKSVNKGLIRIQKNLQKLNANKILSDSLLDL